MGSDCGTRHRSSPKSSVSHVSSIFRDRGELIDHLLVSHMLIKTVQTVTTSEIEIPSITDQPSERQGEPGSDHRPVVAGGAGLMRS